MPHTKEFIERLRKRMRENNPVRDPKVRKKISKTWFKKGEHANKETEFKKGHKRRVGLKHSEETKKKLSLKKLEYYSDGKHPVNWKGDDVSYVKLHAWVAYHRGKPEKCEFCGKTEGRLEWANKSRKYKRDLNDWISLCKKCHYHYDFG